VIEARCDRMTIAWRIAARVVGGRRQSSGQYPVP